MSRRSVWPLLPALLLAASATACDDGTDSTYQFEAADSPINVDTPELRAAKDAAGIDDCPTPAADDGATDGGLPDITLPCLGGGPAVDLASLGGQPMLINLWAQNCAPCRVEAPLLQQVHTEMSDRVAVLGIDWEDSQPDAALAFADQFGVTYPQLADPEGATRSAFQVRGLPVTVFVDADGEVAFVKQGPFESADELDGLLREHLGMGGAS